MMKFKLWEHRGLLGEREKGQRATPNPAPGEGQPSGSYTTDVLNFISSNSFGPVLRGVPAAIEICAGVWQRGMSTAEVSPRNGRTAALTPSILGYIGRYLLRYGEVLFEIGIRRGQITLTPAQGWTVTGGIDPASWMYEATFQSPSTSITRTLSASRVLHLMYAQSHHAPWLGIGPLSSAGLTQELVAQIETALAQEAGTPRGYNFPVPDVGQAGRLTTELRSSKGALNLVPSVASDVAWGQGMESKPSDDWVAKRFGFSPPLPMVELRSRAELSILAAGGCADHVDEHLGWDGEKRRLSAVLDTDYGPHRKADRPAGGGCSGCSRPCIRLQRPGGSGHSGEGACLRAARIQRGVHRGRCRSSRPAHQ